MIYIVLPLPHLSMMPNSAVLLLVVHAGLGRRVGRKSLTTMSTSSYLMRVEE